MGRPKNEKLKAKIAKVAREQFRELGYDGTPYSSIAKTCGISRSLVQYHFPKKQLLAIDFMEDMLAFNADWALERSGAASGDVPDDVMCTVVTHMGGFYELLYFCLKEGLPFDVRAELPPVVKAFEDALAGTRHLPIA